MDEVLDERKRENTKAIIKTYMETGELCEVPEPFPSIRI